jgi:hypothetical protein
MPDDVFSLQQVPLKEIMKFVFDGIACIYVTGWTQKNGYH